MQYLFDNLLSNAIKFANDSSNVYISSNDFTSLDHSEWGLDRPGQRYEIADTGLGIPDADLDRIFQPYVQGRARVIGRVIPGTGLGLFLCKRMVDAHGGLIRAESTIPERERRKPYPEDMQACAVRFVVDLPKEVRRRLRFDERAANWRRLSCATAPQSCK